MATFLGDDDTVACVVVKNTTGRYSIWPPDRPVPEGWVKTGFAGTRAECLRHIEQVWPDPTAAPVSADAKP
ncbi:MbtH family NRPS accessory protein [Nonomuraea typhae]|uniref:MbtH family NRPS accessory protein n=1 Tax=Nonomuraea typhae TaxID=2603600 RepID=A0ABW7Z9I9_9ACTN